MGFGVSRVSNGYDFRAGKDATALGDLGVLNAFGQFGYLPNTALCHIVASFLFDRDFLYTGRQHLPQFGGPPLSFCCLASFGSLQLERMSIPQKLWCTAPIFAPLYPAGPKPETKLISLASDLESV